MGVNRTDYIIYGWKLPFKPKDRTGKEIDRDDDKFLPYVEGHPGIKHIMVVDGMSGEYIAFGEEIGKFEEDEGEGIDFKELDLGNVESKDELISLLSELFNIDPPSDPKYLVFTHWH